MPDDPATIAYIAGEYYDDEEEENHPPSLNGEGATTSCGLVRGLSIKRTAPVFDSLFRSRVWQVQSTTKKERYAAPGDSRVYSTPYIRTLSQKR